MKEKFSLDRFGWSYYEYWDGDIDPEILSGAVERLVARGMGATVGETEYSMSKDLGVYIANTMGHTNRPITAIIHGNYNNGRLSLPQVERELSKHFYKIETAQNTYWFPNSTPKKTAKRWLNDDFTGTMENPNF